MTPRVAFRAEVHAAQARSMLGEIVLIRPLSHVILSASAVAITAAILSYLFLAEHAKKAHLAGVLVPASGAIRVVAQQPGLVRECRVREGARVAAGEALLRLVDTRATGDDGPVGAATLALAQQRSATLRRQRDGMRAAGRSERQGMLARIGALEAETAQLEDELRAIRARELLGQRSLERLLDLERRGFVAPAQRQQKEEEALDHRVRRLAAARSLHANRREISALRLAAEEARSRADAQLAGLDAQLAAMAQEEVERRSRSDAVVTSPTSGTVAALLAEPGQFVAAGASLLTLLPEDSPLEAHVYAPTRAVGFIRAGQEVLLRYPAFPYQKFGSHRARVLSVSRSALAPAELAYTPADGAREPLYRVKVALAAQTVAAYGRAEPLQAGMLVEADVLLDRRRLIEWVFEPLYSLAGRA